MPRETLTLRRSSITITLRQARLLLEFFGDEDCEVTVSAQQPGQSPGLYAWASEHPEEGSLYLGPTQVKEK